MWNLIEMAHEDDFELKYRVNFIPEKIAKNHMTLKIMSALVLLITGFFAVPVFVLM